MTPQDMIEQLERQLAAEREAREQGKKLYEMTLSNEMQWMKKWEEERESRQRAEAACAEVEMKLAELVDAILNPDRMSGMLVSECELLLKKNNPGSSRRILAQLAAADELAERYSHCRHACLDCFCTKEARDYKAAKRGE